ncbi:type IX secretion system sortase PorU [Carboxylicivirga mesophila]|uniref:Type IX secretion system sortase PorU n=1 Tax=Carboxylicivirga mesophila TaxID=1166478 RepID=A0ABS5KH05_9BACT|nr:type IX secretion system sortase PorU [Carboxylicivirga mesophila]MBS2213543.1 type IX secretion system sortase PorU [Carboxylicivirga mesophila]
MKQIIVVLVMWSCYWVNAQEHTGRVQFQWIDGEMVSDVQPPVQFKDLSFWDDVSQLPVKKVDILLPGYIHPDSVDIKLSFETTLITDSLQLAFLTNIDKDFFTLLTKNTVNIRGEYFLQLVFQPIIFDELEQHFYRLEQITYETTIPKVSENQLQLKGLKKEASASVLASGKWVKIKVNESGVHKIPYSLLSSWGFTNPSNVNVFGNGGNMLPLTNGVFEYEDLEENAILHDNNAIYFYAQGPVGWHYNSTQKFFDHQLHNFSDVAYYFLSEDNGEGKRVQLSELVSSTFTNETDEFDSYQFHELENQNLLKSGRKWYGLRFDPQQARTYSFEFKNRVKEKDVRIKTNVIARSNVSSSFETQVNDKNVQTINVPAVDYNNYVGAFANEGLSIGSFSSNDDLVSVNLRYKSEAGSASGWLNYITLNAKEKIVVNDQLSFRNADFVGDAMSTRYYLSGVSSSMELWDVTRHTAAAKINIENYNGKSGFTYHSEDLREFVAFDKAGNLPQPGFEESVINQNLRGMTVPDMLIVVHPLFESEARRLAAIHARHSGLQCEVVSTYQVYNEFSSGSPDVSAIRDLARHLYKQGGKFKYLLLFGDGSYDNKTYDDKNTNFILTYQSDNSINVQYSYVSDDFFGCLDDGEGANILYNGLDIGIGRFPVSTMEQAKTMVDKVETYLFNSEPGPWKTKVTFVGDDGDSNLHMTQADTLSRRVFASFPAFNQQKIYFDAYTKVTTSTGDRYPEVNEEVNKTIEQGTLIFNYTGHGSERQLAHENILDIPAIKKFTNINRLSVFMTATCEFSRYDDYHDTSAGEWVVLSPLGGGVAMFTTTRIAWSNSNLAINKSFYKYIFEKDENEEKLRLGEVMMSTKNELINSNNRLNFTLLGDPALQLAYPSGDIVTHSINGNVDSTHTEVLNALTIATIEGEITQAEVNEPLVSMQVFDKPITVKTLGNKGAVPFEYQVYQSRIYSGQQEASGEFFQSSFVVPKDIRYNVGAGRISYYSTDANGAEAFGADNSVLIGGVSDNPPNDTEGPEIAVWLNDSTFVSGGLTGSQPVLLARLYDENGINASGVGIGHDITLVIDDNRSLPVNLNSYYEADKNSFTSGTITYQLRPLDEGMHKLELKAWDNLNNSSVTNLDFEVYIGKKLNISNASVYPNPLEVGGTMYLEFEHDAPNMILDVTCSLYSISGRLIDRFETQQPASGTSVKPIEWRPRQLQKGLYVLQCEIRSPENQVGKFSKKILVIR